MRNVLVHLESTTPYSQSRMHDAPKLDKETMDKYEIRTWREHCNTRTVGKGLKAREEIVIPAMALKQAVDRAAQVLGRQIPGKGKSTYSKHFLSGVLCLEDVPINQFKDEVSSVTINANSDGVRGSGKRVARTYPIMSSWSGMAKFVILDDTVTPEVFEETMRHAGMLVGIGRFRAEKGGTYGRFNVKKFVWE
jgi:hypothetical protein